MKSLKSTFFLSMLLVLASCSAPQSDSANNTRSDQSATPPTDQNAKSMPEKPLQVSFLCDEIADMESPNGPSTQVSVVVNGKKTIVDTVAQASPFEAGDFQQYEVPANALAACGGWFAGGGDYFFAVEESGAVVVFAGWQDEMQEDEGFHYQKKWAFALPGKE